MGIHEVNYRGLYNHKQNNNMNNGSRSSVESVVVVVRDLVRVGAVIDTVVAVLTDGMRADLLMDLNANMFGDVITAFEFVMSGPLAECRC